MPKVSFLMASAYCEWVFGIQTNTARKIHRSDHTEGRLTTAPSGCCVRKGTPDGTSTPQSRQFVVPRGAMCRKPGSVMCATDRASNETRLHSPQHRNSVRTVPVRPDNGLLDPRDDAKDGPEEDLLSSRRRARGHSHR